MALRMLREVAPKALDDLDAERRREFYRDVELKALVNADGSVKLTWLVDLETGEVRWETAGTSTR
jgi:hypothetical protein